MLRRALVTIRQHPWSTSLAKGVARLPGVGGLARRLAYGVLPRGERVWAQVNGGPGRGLWIKADPYHEVGYLRGCPEAGVLEAIQQHLRPGGCVFDVGAHIGFYSLVAARLVGQHGRVVAFEPDPDNADLLEANLQRNGFSQAITVRAAVWRESGRLPFHRGEIDDPRSSTRTGGVRPQATPGKTGRDIVVEALCLDDYRPQDRRPDFIKVDVEGAEAEVIEGGRRLLEEVKPILLLEVHHPKAAEFLKRHLTQKGYELDWLPATPGYPFLRHLLARPREPVRNLRESF